MKLLVSDYDGTFNEDGKKIKIDRNIESIRRFMDSGNVFAFATGRSFDSIKGETIKYNIPYNYLICNNGTSIFDKNDNLIFQNKMILENVIKTLEYLKKLDFIEKIELKDAYGRDTESVLNTCEIICTLKFRNLFDLKKIKDEINFLSSFSFMNVVYLKERFDKKYGVYVVSNIEGIDKEDIYTIGDASNDKGMISEFNGYKMPLSYPSVMFGDGKFIKSVDALVRKIER